MPIKFRATVIKGAGRGKKLGFPTINLAVPAALNIKPGVHLCSANVKRNWYWGLLFFGQRSVFHDFSLSLEVHLLDFARETKIPKELKIEVHQYIRPAYDFKTPEELVKKIGEDLGVARKYIPQPR